MSKKYKMRKSRLQTVRIQVSASSQTKGLERARALHACKTLTPRFTDFLTDFEKKPTVLQSIEKAIKNRVEERVWGDSKQKTHPRLIS